MPLRMAEYENCEFINCDFGGAVFSGIVFIDCRFTSCNLANAKIVHTAFRGADFKDCKMVGLLFESCDEFLLGFSFDKCVLSMSSFFKLKIKNTSFKSCILHDVEFTQADLTGSVFNNCDFANARFGNTILTKADFTTAINLMLDPEKNNLKKAKFALQGLPGLLSKYDLKIV